MTYVWGRAQFEARDTQSSINFFSLVVTAGFSLFDCFVAKANFLCVVLLFLQCVLTEHYKFEAKQSDK